MLGKKKKKKIDARLQCMKDFGHAVITICTYYTYSVNVCMYVCMYEFIYLSMYDDELIAQILGTWSLPGRRATVKVR